MICLSYLDIIAVSKHDSPNKTLLFSLTVLDMQTSNNNQFIFNWHSKNNYMSACQYLFPLPNMFSLSTSITHMLVFMVYGDSP